MDQKKIVHYLKKFKEKNKDKYHIERIGIFGSVARNDASKNSDIDIVVKLTKQDLFNIIAIKQSLEDKWHISVDVVSYRNQMNSFLKKRIDKEAVYV